MRITYRYPQKFRINRIFPVGFILTADMTNDTPTILIPHSFITLVSSMNNHSGHLFVYLYMKFVFRGGGLLCLVLLEQLAILPILQASFGDPSPSCVMRATAGPEVRN